MPPVQDDTDYMRLAPGFGVVPVKDRNRGYDKLEYGPGEGGIGVALDDRPKDSGGDMRAFLAGVAAGADPQELAKQMLSGDQAKGRRGR